jgi:8-hydroxy-5-deazaflavin:NADPH oxidoreductase
MKKIAIIGIGNVGSALGHGLAAKGHTITYGLRDWDSPKNKAAVAKVGGKVTVATIPDAARSSDFIILAVPWLAAKPAIDSLGNLSRKILIDCTNPLTNDLQGVTVGTTTSAAETIAGWAPGAIVVKAFNTTGAENMLNPVFGGKRLTMFVCGDDKDANAAVAELASDIGFDPVDAGPLHVARFLEPMAALWVHLAVFKNFGAGFGFQLVRR